jgi:peptidoglycan/LPS O-acetylase OafA/YrhL
LVSRRRSPRTRGLTKTGSDDSYGVYLAQLVFITALGWLGWRHLNAYMPWPLLCLITVVTVFSACVALTEVLARTPLAKALTGRSRLPRRAPEEPAPQPDQDVGDREAGRAMIPAARA